MSSRDLVVRSRQWGPGEAAPRAAQRGGGRLQGVALALIGVVAIDAAAFGLDASSALPLLGIHAALAALALAAWSAGTGPHKPAPNPTEAGNLAGHYKLIKLLGKGGMGEVWEAEHALIQRPAAIKLISPEFLLEAEEEGDHETAIARFEREAKSTAKLRSPHTIDLYDYGVTADGSLYYVMEQLQGTDLESLVDDHGPLEPARVIDMLCQACESLEEAHQAGLVHRDIKPANIYVCRLGVTYDVIKVLDFGLVSLGKSQTGSAAVKLTADGFVVGTPTFLAPEVATGNDSDGRTDIYSLACVGYWLLTGHFVFEEDTVMRLVVAHAKTPPPLVSSRTDREIPADLEQVIMDCLAKSPADRPQHALELAERLRACRVPRWTQRQAFAWWKTHRPADVPQGSTSPARVAADVAARAPTVGWIPTQESSS